ncbi:MAG: biopolymer transporter ExbD [Candidatus Firestonebacteria bacterium]
MKVKSIKNKINEIPMASMSDIAFLLIIFFIISMSFLYRQGIQLSLPKKDTTPVIVQLKNILILKLDKNGVLYEQNKITTFNKIKTIKKTAAIIKVEKTCRYKYLVSLIENLQKNNITKISLKKI